MAVQCTVVFVFTFTRGFKICKSVRSSDMLSNFGQLGIFGSVFDPETDLGHTQVILLNPFPDLDPDLAESGFNLDPDFMTNN
jgi:hypothetical protein